MTDFKALKRRYEKVFLYALEKLVELDQECDSQTRLELKCLVKGKILYWKIDYSELQMQIHNEHIDIIPKWHLDLWEKELLGLKEKEESKNESK